MTPGTPVDIYWNLHKHCYSIRSRQTPTYGRVIAHSPAIALTNVTFIINKAGQSRCRTEGRKNVHAYLRGYWAEPPIEVGGASITYNPYKNDTFVGADGLPITSADRVVGTISDNHPVVVM